MKAIGVPLTVCLALGSHSLSTVANAQPVVIPGCAPGEIKTIGNLTINRPSVIEANCLFIRDDATIRVTNAGTLFVIARKKVSWGKNIKFSSVGEDAKADGALNGQDREWKSDSHDQWQNAFNDQRDGKAHCGAQREDEVRGRNGHTGGKGGRILLALAEVSFRGAPIGTIDISGGAGGPGGSGGRWDCWCGEHGRAHIFDWHGPSGDNGGVGPAGSVQIGVFAASNPDVAKQTLEKAVRPANVGQGAGSATSVYKVWLQNFADPAAKEAFESKFDVI